MSAVNAFQINVTALVYHEILIGTMKTKDNKVNRLFMDMLRPPGTQHGKNVSHSSILHKQRLYSAMQTARQYLLERLDRYFS